MSLEEKQVEVFKSFIENIGDVFDEVDFDIVAEKFSGSRTFFTVTFKGSINNTVFTEIARFAIKIEDDKSWGIYVDWFDDVWQRVNDYDSYHLLYVRLIVGRETIDNYEPSDMRVDKEYY